MKVIKISIVDDHSVVRSGLSALINSWNGMRVVHEFESGEDFLTSIKQDKHSDVIILDNHLKGITGEQTFLNMQKMGVFLEFMRLICNDREYTYQEIVHIMAIHVRTVDGFRKSLFSKLNMKSKTGLVMFAMKNKLV